MYNIGLGTEVAALNSQVVPISQVVLKTGFTVFIKMLERLFFTSKQRDVRCMVDKQQPLVVEFHMEDVVVFFRFFFSKIILCYCMFTEVNG